VLNELRVAMKLCASDYDGHIVTLLNQGQLSNSSYFYLDMELCDFNLENYIQQQWEQSMQEKIPCFTNDDMLGSQLKIAQIWNIMTDLSSGVAFIHLKGEIHRDLKPRNGQPS
jgi:serine/threonine protein kinase